MVEGVKVYIFLGPPGAGKGTQGKAISEFLKYEFIATGDILRKSIREKTELGRRAEKFVNEGKLVPDDIMIKLIEKTLENFDKKGFILDGFPRTIYQAKGLDKLFKKKGITLEKAIYIDTSSSTILKRLTSRRLCPKCNRIYNLISNPPLTDEVCDECKVALIQRIDDREETIKKRLKVYLEETEPLINYYKKRDILVKVDGNGETEKIFENIKKIIYDNNKN